MFYATDMFHVGLKTLINEGLSEPEFYGDLVYKFEKLIGSSDFSFQFRKIITRYRRIGYNLKAIHFSWLGSELLVCCLAHRGPTDVFLLLRS